MTTTFIGDVHGFDDRLERVLAQAEGELVFVGDLVDRGPGSRAVVQRVRGLCEDGAAACIMGNHEYALVRAVGVPERGIEPCRPLFESWYRFYGGEATVASYGCEATAEALRTAMGEDLLWLADLPWVLEGRTGDQRWIVVHAGLNEDPLAIQLADLRAPSQWWLPTAELPLILYAKEWVATIPIDLPMDSWVISGHVPLEEVYLVPGRIACDTSGGLPERPLSAVIFPRLDVVTG